MRALVIGGSIAGLFTAAFLSRSGWEVTVFERSERDLSGRGAGIVTHDELLGIFSEIGLETTDLGVQVEDRVVLDKFNQIILRVPFKQIVTSWDQIHQLLRQKCANCSYKPAHTFRKFKLMNNCVIAEFENGQAYEGELLIGADGFASRTRRQLFPNISPVYSGYVGWRALTNEIELNSRMATELFPTFSFFTPSSTQIIGYPIAGSNNDLRKGNRRYNLVWYKEASETSLIEMLTDDSGLRHETTIPPPLIRNQVIEQMKNDAKKLLPEFFQEVLAISERPFFSPIYDHHCKTMFSIRVALVGDAACVARPHVGMGVTKAAFDAKILAESLDKHRSTDEALSAFSNIRASASLSAHNLARQLGNHIFPKDANNSYDSGLNPNLHEIVKLTAAMVH